MYQKVGIQKLSKSQISKLVNGHRIRVKHGSGHEIHVSKEQHKKIMSANKKGKGLTIQSDPYQAELLKKDLNHSKAGKGLMDNLKSIGSVVAPVAKSLEPVAVEIGTALLKKNWDSVKRKLVKD